MDGYSGYSHKCRMCGKPAETHLANVRHMMLHLRAYLCMLCGEEFMRGEDLVKHTATHDATHDIDGPVIEVNLADESADSDYACDCRESESEGEDLVKIVAIDLTASDDDQGHANDVALRPGGRTGGSPHQSGAQDSGEIPDSTVVDDLGPTDALAEAREDPLLAPCARCTRPCPASRKQTCSCKKTTPSQAKRSRSRRLHAPWARVKRSRTTSRSAGGGTTENSENQMPASTEDSYDRAPDALHSTVPKPALRRPKLKTAMVKRRRLGRPTAQSSAQSCGGVRRRFLRAPVVSSSSAAASAPATLPPSQTPSRWVDRLVANYSEPGEFGLKCKLCGYLFKSAKTDDTPYHVLRHFYWRLDKTCRNCGERFGDKCSRNRHELRCDSFYSDKSMPFDLP